MPKLSNSVVANLHKARESATLAIETYNRPGTAFRSAVYIVLMVIAWTALFHAIFFKRKIKPFYRRKGSRRFEKIEGEYKAWELGECLRQFYKEQNPSARKNLEFIIGLRNKIEHRYLPALDMDIFGECQALLMNFEELLCDTFGENHALASSLVYALQYSKISEPSQQKAMRSATRKHLQSVRKYIDTFRTALTDDVFQDQKFSYKVFLIPKIGNQAKTSDLPVEFVKYDPNKPEEMHQFERVVALIKPMQVSVANLGGLKPGDVVKQVKQLLDKPFTLNNHARCWRHFNTRPPKSSGTPEQCDNRYCYYDALHKDYVYLQSWVDFLISKLGDPATYELVLKSTSLTKSN